MGIEFLKKIPGVPLWDETQNKGAQKSNFAGAQLFHATARRVTLSFRLDVIL